MSWLQFSPCRITVTWCAVDKWTSHNIESQVGFRSCSDLQTPPIALVGMVRRNSEWSRFGSTLMPTLMAHPRYPFMCSWSGLSIPPGVEHCYVNDRGLEISSRFAIWKGRGWARKMTTPRRLWEQITEGSRVRDGWSIEAGGYENCLQSAVTQSERSPAMRYVFISSVRRRETAWLSRDHENSQH
jgi:hypothetical protein